MLADNPDLVFTLEVHPGRQHLNMVAVQLVLHLKRDEAFRDIEHDLVGRA